MIEEIQPGIEDSETQRERQYREGALVIGLETPLQERLERAKAGLSDLPEVDVWQYHERPVGNQVCRDRQGNLCWPPCHDPRGESDSIRECGHEYEEAFVRIKMKVANPEPERFDHHVLRHFDLLFRNQELRDVIELCWVYRTGSLKTAGKTQGPTGGQRGPEAAEIAAEYVEGTPLFGELLWPVIVAVGGGTFTKAGWGNRRPSFKVARALWVPFIYQLAERLKREPFQAYYERRAKELATLPPPDHLEYAESANFPDFLIYG